MKRLSEAGGDARRGGWKRDQQLNWDLVLKICAVIMGFLAMTVLLVYENFMHSR